MMSDRMEVELLPGLPNDLALPIFISRLPARERARCRCLSSAHAYHLSPLHHHICPPFHEAWLFLCLGTSWDDEYFTASGLHWFLLHPFHPYAIKLDPIPRPDSTGSNLQTIVLPKQGKVLLLGLFTGKIDPDEEDDGGVDRGHELKEDEWQVFDLVHRHWLLTDRLQPSVNLPPLDRHGFAWAVLDDYLYLAGGWDTPYDVYSEPVKTAMRIHLPDLLFLRDTLHQPRHLLQWEPLPDMTEERKLCSGFVFHGCFYVVGGFGSGGDIPALESGEFYDPKTGRWSYLPHMYPHHVSGFEDLIMQPPCHIAVVKDEIYALKHGSTEIFRYDRSCDAWILLGDFNHGQIRPPYHSFLVGVGDELCLINCIDAPSYIHVLGCSPQGAMGTSSSNLRWCTLPVEFPQDEYDIVVNCSLIDHL